ncbi:NAD-dependent malic enzyme [Candidatus Uhrbacteria bacterium CG_4_10_14_0_2_um_filter_41_7]|uniref:NAD-dependent malic enzyme n=1 Tax=Candidatus Uhrbacteria bacterium CG_4_9_14_3_um_filter_41_35 TaxID=1975034 RepID=A0A2M7XDY2_9BACT|nr:MAG: NAD-dependent malic enzyme [Candidatus Uhrbacteria bacterium CG11_big_fil_rev_8_21_14_0_20_41_9]PIZ53776.1 MAG: NAD-dependent malic enzyme [Candidatus Uhrbacteria bacterium CG_4_10_14_0_2_um_filter_41_7]PJA46079.1 MAG: NAD-dependent malic enzyme [Candidatus Uhrbacteria bacterium CG_4_9_14_3_um_filter_41_35]
MGNYAEESLEYHRELQGKIELKIKRPIVTKEDLSLAYTPGVGAVSREIAENPESVWELTGRRNWVAVVSDGSAVLGLGNIGPEAAIPVMEGKAALFKEFGGVDAFPICINTQDTEEIIKVVKALEPTFGGINLEDISAPRCFEIERRLNETMNIPVFHDDQHGTAIVVLAGLLNALKVAGRTLATSKVLISGAGAAGSAIAEMLMAEGAFDIVVTDSKGALSKDRTDLNSEKIELLAKTNPTDISGSLKEVIVGRDVFIGVSAPGILTAEMIKTMATDPIIFAMANPIPEVMPEIAKEAGAFIVATGRSDYPNQVNNVLAFPGIFRGALDAKVPEITKKMKLAAAKALADYVTNPSVEEILPNPLDKNAANAVASAVRNAS